ncbi:MAG: hypothetical protein HQK97_10480, partial [Nitrospirae bacterium]|nr:hypothetical protein [Nitrospirota bacterium]
MKYGKKIDSTLARFIIIAIAAAASIPILFMTLSGSLDDSWKFAIHQARLSGLVFGSDIVFTFGPLGFLTYPIYIDRGLWLAALGYTIFTHLMFWGALYVFLKRSKSGLLSTFYVAAAAVVFIQGVIEAYGRAGESYNYFYLFLMAYAYTQTKDKNIPLLGVISAVSALFCYVKFSLGLAAALMFMTLIVLLALQKRYKEAAMGAVMYAAFKVIAGLVLIGGPMAIAAFFYNSWAIADGYADAMAVDGPQWKLAAAVFAWAVFAVFLMFAIRRKNYGDVSYLALAIGMLFINYKHSAGNGSIFEWDFFVTWGMVFTLYYVKKAQDSTQDRDKEGQGVWIKRAAIAVSLVLCAFAAYEFHLRAAPLKEIVTS